MAPRFSLPLKRTLEVHESCGAHASGLPHESILSISVAEAILTIAGYTRLALARVRMFRRY